MKKWSNETLAVNPNLWVPNLKGMIIGNGNTNWRYDGRPAYISTAYYYGLIDDELYEYIVENCNLEYFNVVNNLSIECKGAMNTF